MNDVRGIGRPGRGHGPLPRVVGILRQVQDVEARHLERCCVLLRAHHRPHPGLLGCGRQPLAGILRVQGDERGPRHEYAHLGDDRVYRAAGLDTYGFAGANSSFDQIGGHRPAQVQQLAIAESSYAVGDGRSIGNRGRPRFEVG